MSSVDWQLVLQTEKKNHLHWVDWEIRDFLEVILYESLL